MPLVRPALVASTVLLLPSLSYARNLRDQDDEAPAALESAREALEAHKPLSASAALNEMLENRRFPEREAEIHYTLGRALEDLQMPHSAQRHYLQSLRGGPESTWFKLSFARLSAIADQTGDASDLVRVAAKLPPEALKGAAADHLALLQGIHALDEGDLKTARERLEQVSESSPEYGRAQYLRGVILVQQSRPRSAVESFTASADTDGTGAEIARLRDLSLLGIARVYYENGNFQAAERRYDAFPRDSERWADSIFERAWTNLQLNQPEDTLGDLLTLRSPYYAENEFLPEVGVLGAIAHYEVCEYDEAQATIRDFEATYRPVHAELSAFLKDYAGEDGRARAADAYARVFGPNPSPTELPKSLFARSLRDRELLGLVQHLRELDAEEAAIAAQKRGWRDQVGEGLLAGIAEDRAKLERRAGLALLRELSDQTAALGDLLTQAQIIEFELADQRRVAGGEYRPAGSINADYAVNTDTVYWPFNGEFWKDELGYYEYGVRGCDTAIQ